MLITKKKVYLFGSGRRCKDISKQVEFWNYEIAGYVDNNRDKWGLLLDGIKIYSPEKLVEDENYIVLTMLDQEDVKKQLEEMDISNRILELNKLKENAIENLELEFGSFEYKDTMSVMFDSLYCLGWGGIEIWNYRVSEALAAQGHSCFLLRDAEQPIYNDEIEKRTVRIFEKNEDFFRGVQSIAEYMSKNLPFVLLNNWSEQALFAAVAVKKKFPDKVRIISVAHFDKKFEYEKMSAYERFSEKILCVSTKIKNEYKLKYGIQADKLVYHESAVPLDFIPRRREPAKLPIKLAFPCRLEKEQKRADLLLKLIDILEEKHVNYILNIAGTGTFYGIIKKYIEKNNLAQRVKLLGHIDYEEMDQFWENQDIYINLSDFEGTSQAMLEAMSHGVVPIVTNVSGVSDFIANGVHGYAVELEDVESVANHIEELFEDLRIITALGENAKKEVWKRCKMSDYIFAIKRLVEG